MEGDPGARAHPLQVSGAVVCPSWVTVPCSGPWVDQTGRGTPHGPFLCRHGGPVLDARQGATRGPPEAAEAAGKCPPVWTPRGPEGQQCPSHMLSAQVAEPWLPRAEEGLWPVEDHLEDSLEDLGAAGVACGGGLGWGLKTGGRFICLSCCGHSISQQMTS